MPLRDGEVFAGYVIERLLGSGAMGEVYLARHPRLPRLDALKVLPSALTDNEEFRYRFNREADLAATLWHPHIVGIHDRGEFHGKLWISMDYVNGTDAGRLLQETYPNGMPVAEALEIVTAVADSLDFAHQRQLLHRDVKPSNILLTRPQFGRPRILLGDFGIARQADEVSGLTATNMTVGSVGYAAPEQLMGQSIDGRADEYGLAATAFHLLTGTMPFQHSNPAVVISKQLTAPAPRLSELHPELANLDRVLSVALSKEPDKRYPNCVDFAEALLRENTGGYAHRAATRKLTVSPSPPEAPGTRALNVPESASAAQLRSLVAKVTALHQAGRWKDVVAVADELAQLHPDDPDPDGMVSDARAKLREAELADRYAQGVDYLHRAHWQEAIRAFTAIEQEQPGYRDADGLLKAAQKLSETAEVAQSRTPPPLSETTTTPALPETSAPSAPVAVRGRGKSRTWFVAAASIVVIGAAVIVLVVVQSSKSSNTSTSTSTSTSISTSISPSISTSTTTLSAPPTATEESGPNETIADYIKKNNIQRTTVTRRTPGAPTIDLPVPEGWTLSPEGEAGRYYGIVFNTPSDPGDPPKITATVEKLTGTVDTDKLLAVASGGVKNLPGYDGSGGIPATLSGFPASRLDGLYIKNGVRRIVAQNTAVIQSNGGIYLLQIRAESAESDADALRAAAPVIVQKTTITP